MPETLKVEDVKSELKELVDSARTEFEKQKEAVMPADKLKAVEAKKAEDKKKADEAKAKADEQAKKDADILAKKPEELNDDEKKRADEIASQKIAQEESKLSAEDKIKRIREESQKRINEVINELKQVKDKTSKDAQELSAKLETLEKEKEELAQKVQSSLPQPDAIRQEVIKSERERISKYLDEDKHLPLDQRREMDDATFDEWMLENMRAATRWEARQELRRDKERESDTQRLIQKRQIDDILRKQQSSLNIILSKDKDLDDENSEKSKLLKQIISEKRAEFQFKPNAPELYYNELLSRMDAKPTQTPEQVKIDELTKQVEALTARIQDNETSDVGINSTRQVKRESNTLSVQEKRIREAMEEVGSSEEMITSALKRYKDKHKE
jgi:hypothetical protein